ncbi:hypothetical protein GGTG_05725 [Gaeumannomyces tritici R3-111a-1]|uniref:SGNH hydrolase-type esterase domain-containing protein n=1 Tax=Gaeumannomyces tritici (strain R3-111a-1) TaxID=644352 RepID=J3NWR3_GAET3|nr:hypothetical protein GGTG_05725 [Gaeumannomyces tritici R3-111a-1]EJT75795.1 hypothetical protein GGTG_05725 [Gaeumannomyces tritici R3-111a-1]
MRVTTAAAAAALHLLCVTATPTPPSPPSPQQPPPYFILTGDSTVAVGGGWGDGFLSFLLAPPAAGTNPAKSGATTVSFRAEGRWDAALAGVRAAAAAAEYGPVVTMQFGHNDQKPDKGISPDQFQGNLKRMAKEVLEAGGTPILITSLTRRTFSGGKVVQNLETERLRAIAAAKEVGAAHLDLNAASTAYINAVGDANGRLYDLAQGDRTHLNAAAGVVFGRMVVDLLLEKRPDFGRYFRENRTITNAIRSGVFVI